MPRKSSNGKIAIRRELDGMPVILCVQSQQ